MSHQRRFTNSVDYLHLKAKTYRVPGLVFLHMAVVLVVRPVANPPAVVWNQNRGMEYVADHAVELLVAREAPVSTANTEQGKSQTLRI
jgi:hypothetical protein